jgi:ribonuclease HI
MADLILYFDGLCEPRNPGGWACYGWLIKQDVAGPVGDPIADNRSAVAGQTVASGQGVACPPGRGSTNNVAEYAALIAGLEALAGLALDGQSAEVRGDSQLVINQMTGAWRCNAAHLLPLFRQARRVAGRVGTVTFRWVPREQNTEADALSWAAYHEARGETTPAMAG